MALLWRINAVFATQAEMHLINLTFTKVFEILKHQNYLVILSGCQRLGPVTGPLQITNQLLLGRHHDCVDTWAQALDAWKWYSLRF